jgi:hypothetical protein
MEKFLQNQWVRYGTVAVIAFVVGLAIPRGADNGTIAVASSPTASPDPVESPSPEVAVDPVVDPVASPSDAYDFTELKFGEALSVTNDDETEDTLVTIGQPTLAKCQYSGYCDDPKTGDRVVQVEITINNKGSVVSEWGSDYFVLEFADGTQMAAGDGSAFDYTPDNSLSYDLKVRPDSTYKSVLVFEAPKGAFSILILTNTYDGEPFGSWS